MELKIPESIRRLTGDRPYVTDTAGKSESAVLLFDDMVLKAERSSGHTESSVTMMRWLEGKLPVPRVIHHEAADGMSYLLMTRIQGKMACDPYYLERPGELLPLLAQALEMLWKVDVSDCPVEQSLDRELREARSHVENGRVDVDDAEPGTFGEGGFRDPYELLSWLEDHRPSCEKVLSHGDLCLPNIFLKDGKVAGFIDLGGMGTADPWRDISLCWRSLKHNFDGSYGGKVYPGFDPDMLFEALKMKADPEKLRYWILLDELF